MAKKVNKKFLVVLTVVVVAAGVLAMAAKIILPMIFKKDPNALVAQAKQFEKEGKIDDAIKAMQLAIAADQSNLQRQVDLGDLLVRHVTVDPQYIRKAYSIWSGVLSVEPRFKPALERVLDVQWAIMDGGGSPSTFTEAREAAAKLVQVDPRDKQAALRLNAIEIRKGLQRLPADEKLVKDGVQKLRDMAREEPADADLPYWSLKGQMWIAEQAYRRGVGGQEEAKEALQPVEPAIEAMLRGQEKNPRMQWRAAQLYGQLASLEQNIGRQDEDGDPAAAATQPTTQLTGLTAATTRPTTPEDRAARRKALAEKTAAASGATSRPAREPAGRFTDRITAAYDAAVANAQAPVAGEANSGTPDYVTIVLEHAFWKRQLGKGEEANEILERLANQLPDEPSVRLAYSEAFRDIPAKRDRALSLLSAPLKLDGLPGMEAVRRKALQPRLDYERISLRLAALERERDPAKRKPALDAIAADVKAFDADTNAQSIGSLEVHGRLALAQGNLADAIRFLQQALDRWPDEVDPRRRGPVVEVLAGAYAQAGQTGQAERLWGGLVERYPTQTRIRVPWIHALIADGQRDEARAQIAELKRIAPKMPELPPLEAYLEGGAKRDTFVGNLPEETPEQQIRKASLLAGAGKTDEAVAMLEAVIKADPKQVVAVNQLAQVYLAADRRDEAAALLDRAVAANPDNASLKIAAERVKLRSPEELDKFMLAQIEQTADPFLKEIGLHEFYSRKSQIAGAAAAGGDQAAAKQFADQAEQHLVAAERLQPNDARVAQLRFAFLLAQKRFQDAEVALQRMAGIAEVASNLPLMRFELAEARNDLVAAEAAAREITRDRPEFAIGWNDLGKVRMAQRRYDEAKVAYTSALERQGRNRDALLGMIQASYSTDDLAGAKSYIERAREAMPEDATFREIAFDHEFKYGNREKVVADREQMYRTKPEDAGNTGALLDMYVDLLPIPGASAPASSAADEAKNKAILEKARKLSDDALKRWPKSPRFAVSAARVKLLGGDFLAGERIIRDFADANPTWGVEGTLQLANYYAVGGKPASADETFAKAVQQSGNDPGLRMRYAQFLLSSGRADDAARQLEGVPGADAARQRVEILLAANKSEEAERALQAALAQNPDSADLSNLQMQFWINSGRIPDVEAAVKQRLAKNDADDAARTVGALAKTRKSPPDFPGAVRDLTDVLTRNPKNVEAQALLAEARFGAGDVLGAIDDLDRAVQAAPLRADFRRKLILWASANGRWPLVTRLATEAGSNSSLSRDPFWLRSLANAQAATGDYAGAERSITQVESMVPKEQLAEVQKEHLAILGRGKSYAKMLKLTDGMLAAGQKDYWVYEARGLAKFGLRDRSSAQEFDTALTMLDPEKNAAEAQAVVTSIAGTLGPAEALKRIAKWEVTSPKWRLTAANLAALNRDFAGAANHLKPLEDAPNKLTPEIRTAMFKGLGAFRLQAGEAAGAVDAYKKFLAEQPNDVEVLNNVASLLSDSIKPPKLDEASEYGKKAYEVVHAWAPSANRSAIYDTYGWILVQSGGKNLDEGVRVLQESVEEFPIIEAHYHLGEAYLQKSPPQPDEAMDQLNRGMQLIEKAKQARTPYDAAYEARIKDAQARASKLATATPAEGAR